MTIDPNTIIAWVRLVNQECPSCCAKKRIKTNPRILWKWVGGSRFHSEFFLGKSSQNSSKPVQIFWSSIHYVFWRSPDGNTKNEIDYIMTDKPSMGTDVTVINRINNGNDHMMVMGSITLNTRAERGKLLNKSTRTRVDTQMIGTKKNTFQIELKHRFTALEEHDDMDSLNKNMTEMIHQSALSIAKQTKKQKNPKISSPTRAPMKKHREMIDTKPPETT